MMFIAFNTHSLCSFLFSPLHYFLHCFLPPLLSPHSYSSSLHISLSSLLSGSRMGRWKRAQHSSPHQFTTHYPLGGRETMETNRNAWASGGRSSEHWLLSTIKEWLSSFKFTQALSCDCHVVLMWLYPTCRSASGLEEPVYQCILIRSVELQYITFKL